MNRMAPTSFRELKSFIVSDSLPFMKNVDEYIEKPVRMLNQLPFIITTSSCHGHLLSDPHKNQCLKPFIWGMVKKDCIFEFIELVEKAKLHWIFNTPKLFTNTHLYYFSKIRDGIFFKLQFPAIEGIEEGRRRFAKLAEIIRKNL